MRSALSTFLILLTMTGCDSIGRVKSENPVLGPPPPRKQVSKEANSNEQALASTGEIQLVSNVESTESFRGNHVIAIVNGEPVFASEITDLNSYKMIALENLVKKGEITEEQFTQIRKNDCKAMLPHVIKKHVLVSELKKTLTDDQQEQLNQQLEDGFKSHLAGMQERHKVHTRYELEQVLAAQGVNLSDLKYLITNTELSKYFEHSQKKEPPMITREELVKEYRARQEEYQVNETVKWQQISVSYTKPGGKVEALGTMEDIIKKLGTGAPFDELAREYSDGPTAKEGGLWDWMQPDSLAEEVLVEALRTLPEGKISQVLEGNNQYHLVRVLKRVNAHTKSFEEVQEEIKKDLQKARSEEALARVYEELKAKASIQTVFDNETNEEAKRELPLPFQ